MMPITTKAVMQAAIYQTTDEKSGRDFTRQNHVDSCQEHIRKDHKINQAATTGFDPVDTVGPRL